MVTDPRREKARATSRAGFPPYGARYVPQHSSASIRERFGHLKAGEESDESLRVAGRVMTLRQMGKASFAHLQDRTGRIQLYLRQDVLGEQGYTLVDLLDLGDLIGCAGTPFVTRAGELTVRVTEIVPLSKAMRPLPEKWHGLKDQELRYRQRELDLLVNEGSRAVFAARAALVAGMRRFLLAEGFLEVETPMLQRQAGGAAARPFLTHHRALDLPLVLRIAPELYLKRLIVGGLERVFELNRSFRNEGISTRHNPEFTMLEIYQAYADYTDMMSLCERMISSVWREVSGGTSCRFRGKEVRLDPPWRRARLYDLVKEATGEDLSRVRGVDSMRRAADRLRVPYQKENGEFKILEHVVDEKVVPGLDQPTFVLDYPAGASPLAKRRRDDPELAERFELYIGGEEVGNAYSEQNDPAEQRTRFEEQAAARAAGDEEAPGVDEDYLRALEHGMPPCGGLGIGVDRLAMILTGAESIRDVILFPLMRPEAGGQEAAPTRRGEAGGQETVE